MPTAPGDDEAMKVHVSQGRVWFLSGDRLPQDSGLSVARFVASDFARGTEQIRVLGSSENARLITLLYCKKKAGRFKSLQVGSPLSCESASRRDNPCHVLAAMRRWNVVPSCGGWHEMTGKDIPSYILGSRRLDRDSAGAMPASDLSILKTHPVYYAVAGIHGIHLPSVAAIVGEILDPRFFIDLDEPDRLSKLESFFGLDPKDIAAGGRAGAPGQHRRYVTLLAAWKSQSEPSSREIADNPEMFPWREYARHKESRKGDLRASQMFLHYLRHTWLDALYPDRKPWVEPLFAPDRFFDSDCRDWYLRLSRSS